MAFSVRERVPVEGSHVVFLFQSGPHLIDLVPRFANPSVVPLEYRAPHVQERDYTIDCSISSVGCWIVDRLAELDDLGPYPYGTGTVAHCIRRTWTCVVDEQPLLSD